MSVVRVVLMVWVMVEVWVPLTMLSSLGVTVTVCGVFQLRLVKVRSIGVPFPAPTELLESGVIVTATVVPPTDGSAVRTTV